MNHISANLAFGRREKNVWGNIGYKRSPKNKRGGGGRAPDSNVTPLLNAKHFWVKLYMVK